MNIIYLRTSTAEQNPQNQLVDCKTIAEQPYEIVEEKQSAFKDNTRPLFEQVKRRIASKEIKQIFVWDWDRLFRNRTKLKEFFIFCKMYGCQVHSYRQAWFEDFYNIPKPFDEIMSELFLNLMGWMAEDESKKKGERVKIAYQNRKGSWGRKSISPKVKQEILKKRRNGLSIREIADSVLYYDKNRNEKFVSKSLVHKTLKEESLNTTRF